MLKIKLPKKLSSARHYQVTIKYVILQKVLNWLHQQCGHFGTFWSHVPVKLTKLGPKPILSGGKSWYSGMRSSVISRTPRLTPGAEISCKMLHGRNPVLCCMIPLYCRNPPHCRNPLDDCAKILSCRDTWGVCDILVPGSPGHVLCPLSSVRTEDVATWWHRQWSRSLSFGQSLTAL